MRLAIALTCMWCDAPTTATRDVPHAGGRLLNLTCTECGTPQIRWVAS